jgi:hypothetical protein
MHPTEGFTVGGEVHKTIPLQHSALRCIGDALKAQTVKASKFKGLNSEANERDGISTLYVLMMDMKQS